MVQEGKESFEDEECSGRPPEADNGHLGAVTEADPLTTKQEVEPQSAPGLECIELLHLWLQRI